jgi:DNA-directed RNA polymerase specialized sigma24 family protein
VTTAEGVTLTPAGFVDEAADTESQAFVRSVLDRVAEVIESLPEITQWVLVMRYYEGMSLSAVAQALGLDQDEITGHWKAGIFAVHGAMLRAAMPG